MNRELIVRFVPGYGYLPIVREYSLASGRPGRELYRGEFKASAIAAAYSAERHMGVEA